jgi:hypothetical protein
MDAGSRKLLKTKTKSAQISYHVPYYHPIRCIRLAAMQSSVSSNRAADLELGLARFRKKAGVSLDQIAQSTKISSRFLTAIESEHFDQLPGGIFSTSYLRQYALAIGYDEHALVAYYNQKMNLVVPVAKGPQSETTTRGLLDRWLGTAAQAPR